MIILDGSCHEACKKWICISQALVASTIAEMDFDDEALSGDEPLSIRAGLL